MAEFVRHHTLQFVAIEQLYASSGHPNYCVVRRIPRREGVDAVLFQNVDGWHRHAGRNSHLLYHVEETPLRERIGVPIELFPTQGFGDDVPPVAQRHDFHQTSPTHQRCDP